VLPFTDRLDTTAIDLRQICRIVEGESDDDGSECVQPDADLRQYEIDVDDLEERRSVAHQLDVSLDQPAQRREGRHAGERHEHAEDQTKDDDNEGELDSDREPARSGPKLSTAISMSNSCIALYSAQAVLRRLWPREFNKRAGAPPTATPQPSRAGKVKVTSVSSGCARTARTS